MADLAPHSTTIVTSSRVERCLALLDAAARGENVATALFEAVVMIQRGREDRVTDGPIGPEQRGTLLAASVRAQAAATKQLPNGYDRASLNAGMGALAYQIHMWAESPERTSRRNQDSVLDFHGDARIFQNELHNIRLSEQKAERAQKPSEPRAAAGSIQKRAAN
jgi:hypothetical protein